MEPSSSSMVEISLNNANDGFNAPANRLNFSIDRILGSEFGTAKKSHHHHQRRLHSGHVDSGRQLQQQQPWPRDETFPRGNKNDDDDDDDHQRTTERRRKQKKKKKKEEENENEGRRRLKTNSSRTDVEEGRDSDLPAWIFCTRYSDRPSSGQRSRKFRRKRTECGNGKTSSNATTVLSHSDEKRVRTCFTEEQLNGLKLEFKDNRYLTEERRSRLSKQLKLTEVQVKIWFQNKRAKVKKSFISRQTAFTSNPEEPKKTEEAEAAGRRPRGLPTPTPPPPPPPPLRLAPFNLNQQRIF